MINLIFLTAISFSSPDFPTDSLRLETINGKLFVIHQVGEKETVYALSKRYGTPIVAILEFNSSARSGLEVGQILKIPYTQKTKPADGEVTVHKVAAKETLFSISKAYDVSVDDLKMWNNLKDNSLALGQELTIRRKQAVAATNPAAVKSTTGTHIVEPKETLFSISKKYGVSVQQLRDWNHLQGDDLKVGSGLVVTGSQAPAAPVIESKPAPEVRQAVVVKEEAKQENNEKTIRISESVRGSDEVKEGGLAELIEGSEGNRKYLGLHRTAKAGAILKVRNELNDREVFVRVVGTLPDTGVNNNVVIKISKSAFDRLGAIDPKFRVEVTYYK